MTTDLLTFNGEPIITHRTVHMIELGDWLYEQEYAASADCSCRRCRLHEDFGGCVVDAALWGLCVLMAGYLNSSYSVADWW